MIPRKKKMKMIAQQMTAKALALALALAFMPAQAQSLPGRVTIAKLTASGDCSAGDVGIIKAPGQDVLRAKFDSLAATAKADGHGKEICSLLYELALPKGRRLAALTFAVDSHYRLGEEGEVRITVKHRIGKGKSFGHTEFRALIDDDPAKGSIAGVAGVLRGNGLSKTHQQPGATIPVTTTIIVSAINGAAGESVIRASEGTSSIALKP